MTLAHAHTRTQTHCDHCVSRQKKTLQGPHHGLIINAFSVLSCCSRIFLFAFNDEVAFHVLFSWCQLSPYVFSSDNFFSSPSFFLPAWLSLSLVDESKSSAFYFLPRCPYLSKYPSGPSISSVVFCSLCQYESFFSQGCFQNRITHRAWKKWR